MRAKEFTDSAGRMRALSSALNMASVVRLSRRASSSSRQFCGVTRSYNSWHSNSEVKKWRYNTRLLTAVSIGFFVGYKYLQPEIVYAKSRKVCKYTDYSFLTS